MGSHTRNALTVKSITASKAVKLRDGGGLWLVTKGGGRYWIFSYTFAGMRREMGLGPLHTVGLADAREKAEEARAMVRRGLDPIAARKDEQADTPKLTTFGAYADAFIDAAVKAGRWRGAKTEARWRNLLENHAKPIRNKALADIGVKDVLSLLRPLWGVKHETAEKLREAIERVLDAAKVEGHRSGENPATWKGNLEHVLHKPDQLANRGHHAAMPFADVPTFMKELAAIGGVGARALEFTILTATRSGETRGATWDEIDLKAKAWTIPARRMKGGKLHRVPLSDQASNLLKKMKEQSINDLVFPGIRDKKPLSDMSLAKALTSAGGGVYTVHGFRSSFRDYATEVAHAPREIAEAALAHAVGDAVERSYARSDALERRRALMQAWADYLSSPSAIDSPTKPSVS
ncbi:integrase [Sinorhizobium meliloti]|uniref:tyrosine-type recombinase/integrase n=1 Tax=Rhizobium meliloti TaxID=382 RepID=UPI000B497DAA|nr:site-specific integrase [Sinorhizobium meliloti]ASP84353.1 integrase [Sinorhizobium meliloti]MQW28588.1 DUF4102 domain-containing protein [Sinorhizobium meliloti]